MSYILSLNDFLKYSLSNHENMIEQLARPEHAATRAGKGDHIHRLVLADALQEAANEHPHDEYSLRTQEALLRDPNQHIVVHAGTIRAGRPSYYHLAGAWNTIVDHLDTIRPDYGGRPRFEYVDFAHLPPHEAAHHIADAFQEYSNRHVKHWPNAATEKPILDAMIEDLRQAPHEEVDWNHPTNQPPRVK